MLSRPGATLGDALATQPGIAATTFAPGASRPVIRGLSGFRVRIQENGLATGDVSALSDDHAVPIDPLAAGQVEVVRGPATLRYGSQAIGGVVNAINNRIPTAIPTNGILVETRGGLSTVDDRAQRSGDRRGGRRQLRVHADTFKRTADDYRIPGRPGAQANTSLDSEGYSLGGSYVFKDGFVGVAYSSFDSTYYIPGIEAAASKNHIVLNQTKLTSRGEWRVNDFGLEAIRFWFGATDYKHDEVDSLPGHGDRLDLPADDLRDAHGGAAPAGQYRSGRAARCRRHAMVEPRSAGGRGRRHPAEPDELAKPRRLRLRGAAADQAPAPAGRRPHRGRRRDGHRLDLSAELPAAARTIPPKPRRSAGSPPRASAPACSTTCRSASSRG